MRPYRFDSGVLALAIWACCFAQAPAQFQFSSRYELSEAVYLEEADNAARAHLARLKNYQSAGVWDDALDVLQLLMQSSGERLIDVGDRRYLSVRSFCQRQLCALPPEALTKYRTWADSQAGVWYQAGMDTRSAEPLLQIVEKSFASSWGDDALLMLGELAMESGDHDSARAYWRMILAADQYVTANPSSGLNESMFVYPDSKIPAADLNARLVLASILAGQFDRAQRELEDFTRRHAAAKGNFGGREVNLAEALESLLTAGRSWPATPRVSDWPTFAGSPERDRIATESIDVGAKQWEVPLQEVSTAELIAVGARPFIRPVASNQPLARRQQRLLSYYPLVVNGLVLINTAEEILALDLKTGRPAWGNESPVIFEHAAPSAIVRRAFNAVSYGAPRFSMTAANHRLYARLGSPLTSNAGEAVVGERLSYLVCLDLAAQGRLVWKTGPEMEKFAFEGSPIVDGKYLYVALRRSDVRPQAHVACYDADTGERRWLRQICSAETLGRGQFEETTSNLLTLHGDSLYFNTNLGAVARLSTRDGHVQWVKVYRQRQTGDAQQPHAYLSRDMTPCIYSEGRVFVAPSDSERIYALNAETGDLLWDTRYTPDAVHLLGVGSGNLIVSGDRLYWINCESGKLVRYWPDGNMPKGYGRGILAGDRIYWPTRESILVFEQATGRLERNVDLRGKEETATAGNLLIADGLLLVAATDRLVAYGQFSKLHDDAVSQVPVDATKTQ